MRIFSVFFLSIFFLNTGFAFQKSQAPIVQTMEKYALDFLENSIAHSVSIAVYHNGQQFISHHGELDPAMKNRPTDATVYEIASVTKTFTGLLTAKAVLDGKLTLDADIRTYMEGDYPNLEKNGVPIRVKHLITHTSGLPAEHKGIANITEDASKGPIWQRRYLGEKLYSKERFFADLKKLSLNATPGTTFVYSNLSTNMMAHLLERVYGKSFEALLEAHIFNKANMRQTHLTLHGADRFHLASGYNENGILMPHLPLSYTLWGAEGALKSTVPDMIRYMRFLLKGSNPIVKEAQQRLFKLDDGYWVGYFWWIINLKNRVNNSSGIKTLRHDGGAIGTRNVFRIYPENDLGIWVVTNVVGPDIFDQLTKLSYDLSDAILK